MGMGFRARPEGVLWYTTAHDTISGCSVLEPCRLVTIEAIFVSVVLPTFVSIEGVSSRDLVAG